MKQSYQDFIHFCKSFQVQNEFGFNEQEIKSDRDGYYFDATYRDESNYKSNVRIYFIQGNIGWHVTEGWEDAYQEINFLFKTMFPLEDENIDRRMEVVQAIDADSARVYEVFYKLKHAIHLAESGKIKFAAVFDSLPIRSFLPQYTVLATTWHVDDIRDRFSNETTDEALFETLQKLESGLNNVAVSSGQEWIEWELPAVLQEEE